MKSKIIFAASLFCAVQIFAQVNLYVAADGSAKFKSVQEAVMSVPSGTRENPVIIHVAPGTYHELIYIQREKRFFKLVGDNATNTFLDFCCSTARRTRRFRSHRRKIFTTRSRPRTWTPL